MEKRCTKCKSVKPLENFWKNNLAKDGRQSICIECQKTRWVKDVTNRKEVRAKFREREKLYDDKNIEKYLWTNAKRRAQEKELEFTIAVSDITVPDLCPITLRPMERSREKLNRDSYTLDRIDSSMGYIPGNVAVISQQANMLKNNFTLEEVERLLKYMTKGDVIG